MKTRTRKTLAIVLVMASATLLAQVAKKAFSEEDRACVTAYEKPATTSSKAGRAGLAFIRSTGHFGMYEAKEEGRFITVRAYSPYVGDQEFLLDAETGIPVDTKETAVPDGWNVNTRAFAYCQGEEPELILAAGSVVILEE